MSSPPKLHIAYCDIKAAKYAVTKWHYSRVMPAAPVRYGVWEHGQFVGAVMYGLGAGNATRGEQYGLAKTHQVAELQRVALKDGHETPTSKIVAITIRLLKQHSPNLRLLISFADELGQGHHGGIYQAGNWIYTGAFEGDGGFTINGKAYHSRSVYSKGWVQSVKWLRENVDPKARKNATRKHRYLYPLDDEMRARIAPLAKPYPKRASEAGHSPNPG